MKRLSGHEVQLVREVKFSLNLKRHRHPITSGQRDYWLCGVATDVVAFVDHGVLCLLRSERALHQTRTCTTPARMLHHCTVDVPVS